MPPTRNPIASGSTATQCTGPKMAKLAAATRSATPSSAFLNAFARTSFGSTVSSSTAVIITPDAAPK